MYIKKILSGFNVSITVRSRIVSDKILIIRGKTDARAESAAQAVIFLLSPVKRQFAINLILFFRIIHEKYIYMSI